MRRKYIAEFQGPSYIASYVEFTALDEDDAEFKAKGYGKEYFQGYKLVDVRPKHPSKKKAAE